VFLIQPGQHHTSVFWIVTWYTGCSGENLGVGMNPTTAPGVYRKKLQGGGAQEQFSIVSLNLATQQKKYHKCKNKNSNLLKPAFLFHFYPKFHFLCDLGGKKVFDPKKCFGCGVNFNATPTGVVVRF
jgi:hypothetical protein